MTSLARLTLGRLVPPATGGGVTLPSVLDVSIAVPVAAKVAAPSLTTQVQSPLVISVAESIIGVTLLSPIAVDLEIIQVEVDIY